MIYTLTTSKHTFEFSYNLNFLNILCKLIIVGRGNITSLVILEKKRKSL